MRCHLTDSVELENTFAENYWLVQDQDLVCIPSLTFDQKELEKIAGCIHYEERQLFNLLLLKHLSTRIIYITSTPLDPVIVKYYISLLPPSVPREDIDKRLILLSTNDLSPRSLAEKILERPHLVERVKDLLRENRGLLLCFTCTELEMQLSRELGIPLFGNAIPELSYWGSKSGSREIFEEAGIPYPKGVSQSTTAEDLANKISTLFNRSKIVKWVVKLNHGFSGKGNAILDLGQHSNQNTISEAEVLAALSQMQFSDPIECWDTFNPKIKLMGAIAEEFFEGEDPKCPSVQGCISSNGDVEILSTHEQVLHGQVYQGCVFPASDSYRTMIQRFGRRVGRALAQKGVRGHFGVDFLVRNEKTEQGEGKGSVFALEINLRQCGTTHPYFTMKFLSDGIYDKKTGLCNSSKGAIKYYTSSDNLHKEKYKGLLPQDIIDEFAERKLTFDYEAQSGVVFHLMGSLSEHGKVGITCVANSVKESNDLFHQSKSILEHLSTTCGIKPVSPIPQTQ